MDRRKAAINRAKSAAAVKTADQLEKAARDFERWFARTVRATNKCRTLFTRIKRLNRKLDQLRDSDS